MESIPRWNLQVLEPRDGIELIQLPADDGPDRAQNAARGLAVDTVPDVSGRIISERPDHPASTIARLPCYAGRGASMSTGLTRASVRVGRIGVTSLSWLQGG